jgi:malate synthase
MGAVVNGVQVNAPVQPEWNEILSAEALGFVAGLARAFEGRRAELLKARDRWYTDIDAGKLPTFLDETQDVRAGNWTVAEIPADLQDRRVEITGPVDRKMVINALNSGAQMFMADLEDSNSPTWENCVAGQLNLRDAVAGTIAFENAKGKKYALGETVATLLVRPRGWHLVEKHMTVDDSPVSASLFDFGLFFFHNAKALLEKGSGPYFYLPKLEGHLEARLWNDVFNKAQDDLGVPRGSIRATVLLETLPAAFQMDEILYELRDHSSGLNCGRWDYIFSFIKSFKNRAEFVMPDRGQIGMDRRFLDSYVQLLIQTCHKRGAHAMGGMAAQIPIKGDPDANQAALDKVRGDKLREVKAGHDGTWVAHPGLVSVALEAFAEHMSTPNQLSVTRDDVSITPEDLVAVAKGTITEAGLRTNINVGVLYLEAWLRGSGCVPLYNLMEDAATAEISRTQVWQWVKHGAHFDDGPAITPELVRETTASELKAIREAVGEDRWAAGKYQRAGELFNQLMTAADCAPFLTTLAYEDLQ